MRPGIDLRDVLFDGRMPEHRIAPKRFDLGILVLIAAAILTWGVVAGFGWFIWAWVLQ